MIAGILALVGVVAGLAIQSAVSVWLEKRRWHRDNAKWFAQLDRDDGHGN